MRNVLMYNIAHSPVNPLPFYHGRSLVLEGGQRCYIFVAQRFYQQRDRWNDLYLAEGGWISWHL
jgi:hypothetical protein